MIGIDRFSVNGVGSRRFRRLISSIIEIFSVDGIVTYPDAQIGLRLIGAICASDDGRLP